MSHFGRYGPPDIRDTYSLLVLNITFRTTADDLFPLFDKYGKVVDIFIPRDRRTGDSRGFAFVRYKYADEAQKAVERLDGRNVDGRNIMVQFAKYGPNAERIHKGRIVEVLHRSSGRSRSRSPRPRYRDDYRGRRYRSRSYSRSRSRSRSRSHGRYERDRYARERDYRRRSRSRSLSPDYSRGRRKGKRDDDRSRSPSRTPSRSRSQSRSRSHSRSHSLDSASPLRRSPSLQRSQSPHRSSPEESPDRQSPASRPPSCSPSPRDTRAVSHSPSTHSADE